MPIDPMSAAAVAKAGAGIYDALSSDHSDYYGKQATIRAERSFKRQNTWAATELPKLRVQGAKDAGLHPLYALGGASSVTPATPIIGGSPSSGTAQALQAVGQGIEDYARGRQTATQKEMVNLQLNRLRAETEKELAIAGYYASETARNLQSNLTTKALPDQPPLNMRKSAGVPTYQENIPAPNMFVTQPDVVVSKRSNDQAVKTGVHAGLTEITLPGNLKMVVPGNQDSLQEIMAEGNAKAFYMLYNINKAKYGPDHARRVVDLFLRGNVSTRSGGSGW